MQSVTQLAEKLSCAGCTGLQVDIDRIREDNEHRTDVERKAGLIIWSGRKLRFSEPNVTTKTISPSHFGCCANRQSRACQADCADT